MRNNLFHLSPVRYLTLLIIPALILAICVIWSPLAKLLASSSPVFADAMENTLFFHATLPRISMALIAGAGLGASGVLLQYVMRNPLASPTTLGIDAGAKLAIALSAIFIPDLVGIGRDMIALIGSLSALLIVFLIAKRHYFSPHSFVLAGLIIGLYCGTLSSVLMLLKERYLGELFIWGSGSLLLQSWEPVIDLASRLSFTLLLLFAIIRPLSVLELGDTSAKALGASPVALRIFAIVLAAAFAAFVTSAVGIIGFIGLIAPLLSRLAGARGIVSQLILGSLTGALLLLITDLSLQLAAGSAFGLLPAGAVTAIFGAPLFLILLSRLGSSSQFPESPPMGSLSAPVHGKAPIIMVAVVLIIACALFVGRSTDGAWEIADFNSWTTIFEWRLPRVVVAACSGALLSTVGVIIQRMTRNPLASPEVLGISSGAILAAAVALFILGDYGTLGLTLPATVGAFLVFIVIWSLGKRTGFSPEQVLLTGIALNALLDTFVGVMTASGDPRAMMLLGWMVGSTNSATGITAMGIGMATMLMLPVSFLFVRWLTIIPLGEMSSMALGVRLTTARFYMFLYAALVTAITTLAIGPLTFIGLLAPHLVSALGIRSVSYVLPSAAAVGAALMALADWVARTAFFPIQISTGLMAALVGIPFLLLLLSRKVTQE